MLPKEYFEVLIVKIREKKNFSLYEKNFTHKISIFLRFKFYLHGNFFNFKA